jgi:hypothetical protein
MDKLLETWNLSPTKKHTKGRKNSDLAVKQQQLEWKTILALYSV